LDGAVLDALGELTTRTQRLSSLPADMIREIGASQA
jgi:hypothetical protein